jgi:hypothetical protein
MGSVLVAIFWIWCGVSLVILISRPFYRRAKARSAAAVSLADSNSATTMPSLTRVSTTLDPVSRPSASSPPTLHGTEPGGEVGDLDPSRDLDDFEPTSLFETSPPETSLFETSPPDTSLFDTSLPDTSLPDTSLFDTSLPDTSLFEKTSDGSLFERPDPHQPLGHEDPRDPDEQGESSLPGPQVRRAESFPDGSGAIRVRTRSVAEVLAGIQMPCDLAPLTGFGEFDDTSHVVFATEGHPAHRVGVSVGDELERIGCLLEPVDTTTLWAQRGSDSLEVRIHPDAAEAMDGEERRFPTASQGAVVVEFRLR